MDGMKEEQRNSDIPSFLRKQGLQETGLWFQQEYVGLKSKEEKLCMAVKGLSSLSPLPSPQPLDLCVKQRKNFSLAL